MRLAKSAQSGLRRCGLRRLPANDLFQRSFQHFGIIGSADFPGRFAYPLCAFFVRNDVLSFLRWHELPHGNATKTNAPTAIINMIITPIPTNNAKAFSRRRSRASFSALRVSSPNMQLAPQMIAMLRF
jgi:hypothetical protein